jgi:hypothetical protein
MVIYSRKKCAKDRVVLPQFSLNFLKSKLIIFICLYINVYVTATVLQQSLLLKVLSSEMDPADIRLIR